MFGFIADAITSVVSVLLPVFGTYKAIRTRDTATLTLWLIYWTTLALVFLAESHFYFFLRWLPLYSWIRLAMYVYLVAPGQTHGSFFIYKEYIHPFLHRHEAHIDRLVNDSNTRAFAVGWDLLVKGLQFVQIRILNNQDIASAVKTEYRFGQRKDISRRISEWNSRTTTKLESRFEELGDNEDTGLYASPRTYHGLLNQTHNNDSLLHGARRRLGNVERESYEADTMNKWGPVPKLALKDREEMIFQSAMDRLYLQSLHG